MVRGSRGYVLNIISLLAEPEPTMMLHDGEDTAEDLGFIAHRSAGK